MVTFSATRVWSEYNAERVIGARCRAIQSAAVLMSSQQLINTCARYHLTNYKYANGAGVSDTMPSSTTVLRYRQSQISA